MRSEVTSQFITDEEGNPSGGKTEAIGIDINWQHGVVSEGGHNGAFLEDVLEAARQRLLYFNESKFRCRENSLAITKIEEALQWLAWRTRNRETQGVEDSYKTHKS